MPLTLCLCFCLCFSFPPSSPLSKNKKVEMMAKRRNMRAAAAPVPVAAVPPAPGAAATAVVPVAPAAQAARPDVADLPRHVANINSGDAKAQFEGTHAVRRMLSKEKDPPVVQVLQSGVLPRLVEFLKSPDAKMQFEAAWAITNIASTEHTRVVVDAGCMPLMVQLLRSPSADVREQCIWCLGNISGDGPELRDMVLAIPGAVTNLLLNIQRAANDSLLKNATWTLSNYCRGKPQPPLEAVRPLIPAFAHLLTSPDVEVLTDACWGLSYLTDGDNPRIQAVVDAGVASRLVQLLAHDSPTVVVPALRTVGNIVTGSDEQTQAILDADGLPALARLVMSRRRNIAREACWASSNVSAGTPPQIARLVDTPGMVDGLLHQLSKGDFGVRKEACWALSNALTTGEVATVHRLVAKGSIEPLVQALSVDDARIVQVALEAVTAVLEAGGPPAGGTEYSILVEEAGGVDALETLQEHSNNDIYEKAVSIIETYFGVVDGDEDENVAPAIQDGGGDRGRRRAVQPVLVWCRPACACRAVQPVCVCRPADVCVKHGSPCERPRVGRVACLR